MNTDTTEKSWKDWALRAVALVGLVAVLILGAWGIIQLAFDLPDVLNGIGGGISSLFEQTPAAPQTQIATTTPAAAESISVTNPSLVTAGQVFTLSWTHTGGSGDYAYQISYACATGLSLKAPLPTGATQVVPCNTPFNYTNATQNMMLTPTLVGNKQVSMTFSVAAQQLSTNTVTAVGSTTITILPTASLLGTYPGQTAPASKTATAPAATYSAAKAPKALYGLPNLTSTIVSATPTAGGYSVEFLIRNTGTNTVGSGWTFAAQVPTSALSASGGYNYQSQPQRALTPGSSILYTMNFSDTTGSYNNYSYPSPTTYQPACGYTQDYTYTGYASYPNGTSYNCSNSASYATASYSYPSSYSTNVFSVTADPSGYVSETSKADNTASVTL